MDHNNPVPDQDGNMIGFLAIGLTIAAVLLFVFLKNWFWVSDRDELIKNTATFLQSLPSYSSHIALTNTFETRQEAEQLLAEYTVPSTTNQGQMDLEYQLSFLLTEIGEDYLRADGLSIAKGFKTKALKRIPNFGPSMAHLITVSNYLIYSTQFDLTGNQVYWENMIDLKAPVRSIIDAINDTESDNKNNSDQIVFDAFDLTDKLISLDVFDQILNDVLRDETNYTDRLLHFNSAAQKYQNKHPKLEASIFLIIGSLLSEQYADTKNPTHAEQALNKIKNGAETFPKLLSSQFSLHSAWGFIHMTRASIKISESQGLDAVKEFRSALASEDFHGFMNWIKIHRNLSAAYKVLAEITDKPEYWDQAYEALSRANEILDSNKHQFLWANIKLEMGQTNTRRSANQAVSSFIKDARTECAEALNIFKELEVQSMISEAQDCLSKLHP